MKEVIISVSYKVLFNKTGSVLARTAVGNVIVFADHVEIHGNVPAVLFGLNSYTDIVESFNRLGSGRSNTLAGCTTACITAACFAAAS